MYIKEGVITGYTYELYYDGSWVYSSADIGDVFDTEDELMEDAREEIKERIKQWKVDGGWEEEYDSEDLFYIDINDVIDDEEEDEDE